MQNPLRSAALGAIWLYKRTLSPVFYLLGARCRHQPTCSDYAAEAFRKHRAGRALWLSLSRISRCHPWGSHGFDPVPDDRPNVGWRFWRLGDWAWTERSGVKTKNAALRAIKQTEPETKVDPSRFVGEIPVNYDHGLGPVIFEDYAADLARRAEELRPFEVLELAAGTGIVSRKLRDVLPSNARLVVTDLNQPMLDVARTKFGDNENVEFIVADAMKLDFSGKHFDLIVCQFGVMFFPDKIASFREALRVLRPGGTYLFNTWREMEENRFAETASKVAAEFFPDDPPQFYKTPFSYPDAKTVCKDMSAAGFQDIESQTVALQKDVKDWSAFARGIIYGNAIIDEIKKRGGVDPDDVMRVVAQELRRVFGPEPGPLPLKATVFRGRA